MGDVVLIAGAKRDWREVPFTERLLELYARVAYMEKGGTNKHFKYKFLQEAQLKERVNLACRDLGIVLLQVHMQVLRVQPTGLAALAEAGDAGEARKPLTQECVVQATVRLADAWTTDKDNRLNMVELQGLGGGTDSGDKAPMKACVAAFKYALMNGLLVATGDEPEQDRGDDERAERLLADLAGCESVAALQVLKVRVAGFKGGVAFDALREAYKAAAARLTTGAQ